MKILTKKENKSIIVNTLDIMFLSKTKFKKLLHKFGKSDKENNFNSNDALLIIPKGAFQKSSIKTGNFSSKEKFTKKE